MALPDNAFSSQPVGSPLLPPDDRQRALLTEDFERGGVALNDPNQGLDVRDWVTWTDGETIWVAPEPERVPSTAVRTGVNITEVSLAFDQNMQPTLAYVENGLTKLWWYDTVAAAMVTTNYPDAVSPFLTMDDKRELATRLGVNDVIFAYIRAGQVYYRQQRDRYLVERAVGPAQAGSRIVQLGMGRNNRLQFKLLGPPSARFTDLLTDRLYIVQDDGIVDLHGGAVDEATWRSRVYEFHEQPAPGWARVEGDYPCELRVLGDGAVVYTVTVAGPDPVRLPAQRWREWALELRGVNRAVAVSIASTRDQLL